MKYSWLTCAGMMGALVSPAFGPALGAITIDQDTRSVSASVSVTSQGGTASDGPFSRTRPQFGASWESDNTASALATRPGAAASCAAIQLSLILPNVFDLQGSVSSSVSMLDPGPADSATVDVASIFAVRFTAPAGSSISLLSAVSGVGQLELSVVGGGVLFSGTGFYEYMSSGAQLELRASASASYTVAGGNAVGGGYSARLEVIPAPGVAGTLLSVGLLGSRRRRRS